MIEHDEETVDRQRTTDPLTGLLHREAWDRQAPGLLEEADEARVPVCLLLLDLDGFASFNARHGVEEGDRVLKEVAALWRTHVRHNDVVSRVGADDFAVLLVACSLEAASAVARRLCGLLDPERISASAGGAEWNGTETHLELLARADAALSRARERSTDRISIAADAFSSPA
jgi:diguanylate cyclase (GGDEF)-like protein